MLQNPHKTLGFKKNMVYKIPPMGGGKPYPASGLKRVDSRLTILYKIRNYLVAIDENHYFQRGTGR